ncbi:MAG: type II toxin-antitoxin system HicA family toxin [Ignavibacteria bacterium]|nr:type II toxin-antitoxin system HicA family toxin [Ignavibacteria bacterium]
MRVYTGKELCRLLESKGWELQRIRGSHHVYGKHTCIERITVPVHGNSTLARGLTRHILAIVDRTGGG